MLPDVHTRPHEAAPVLSVGAPRLLLVLLPGGCWRRAGEAGSGPHHVLEDVKTRQGEAVHDGGRGPVLGRRQEQPHHRLEPRLPARVLLLDQGRQQVHVVPASGNNCFI